MALEKIVGCAVGERATALELTHSKGGAEMKTALFWDFDGTLVYHDNKWRDSVHAALASRNYEVDIDEIRQYMRKGYSWHTPEVSYTDSIGQKWWDTLFKNLDLLYESHGVLKGDVETINSCFKAGILDHRNYALYEDAATVLGKCADMGYRNFILSNNFPELPLVIKGLGLGEYISGYVVSANIGYEKPRAEIFQYALSLAGFPDNSYMIGDNPVADIQGGKSAGMRTILVYGDGVHSADYSCGSLSEIPLLLAP